VVARHRWKKDPAHEPALTALVEPETAGDPMSAQKWVRSSLRQLSTRLTAQGQAVSHRTAGRLLDKLGYALPVNARKLEACAQHPDRNAQFEHIATQRATFAAAGWPTISVDTKKKELIGDFKNAGSAWSREAAAVNVHDFPSDALGRAVPQGIYDVTHNQGTVYVGASADTPQFAVDVIARWWTTVGQAVYGPVKQLLILADAGGSSDCRPRFWKQQLQEQLCDRLGLTVTVCHLPDRLLQVEPGRTSPVRPHQRQLGRPTLTHLGHVVSLHSRHHNDHRLEGRRFPP